MNNAINSSISLIVVLDNSICSLNFFLPNLPNLFFKLVTVFLLSTSCLTISADFCNSSSKSFKELYC